MVTSLAFHVGNCVFESRREQNIKDVYTVGVAGLAVNQLPFGSGGSTPSASKAYRKVVGVWFIQLVLKTSDPLKDPSVRIGHLPPTNKEMDLYGF